MTTFITVLLVIACIIVNIAVMLQPAKGSTTAFGGSSQSLFGSTGATTFLFKTAMWGGAFIMASCLLLSVLQVHGNKKSVIDMNAVALPVPSPVSPAPTPMTPTAPQNAAPTTPVTVPVVPAKTAK